MKQAIRFLGIIFLILPVWVNAPAQTLPGQWIALGITLSNSGGVLNTTNATNDQGAATAYPVSSSDMGKTILHNAASGIAETLPQAGTTGFEEGKSYSEQNNGAGTLTITPTGSTINGKPSLSLATGQGAYIWSHSSNWLAFTSSVGSLTGTVNSGTQYGLAYYSSTGASVSGSTPGSGWQTNASGYFGYGLNPNFPLDMISSFRYPINVVSSDSLGAGIQLTSNVTGGHQWQLLSVGSGTAVSMFCLGDNTSSLTPFCLNAGSNKFTALLANESLAWSTATQFVTNTVDTGISRASAGVVAIGGGLTGDFSGTLQATHFTSGTTAGVSCSGTPTSSFSSVNGIVTHC